MTVDHQAARLRGALEYVGSPDARLPDLTLRRVLNHIGNADIALDALLQYPRPLWLVEIAGAHWITPSSHELDDPRDIANPGW